MDDLTEAWLADARAAIREAAGEEGERGIEAEWDKLGVVLRPVVTIFGSYDSGKSTLLKRLLVDGGVDVPSWLSISARRETYEIREVDALGCRFRDTPGIAGGNTEHEQLARDAVTLSDVILLVLPPQLLTGDREVVMTVLSGETFRRVGIPMGDAVLTVIAKLDDGTVEPTDNPEGYADYLRSKREEWARLLDSQRVDLRESPVFTVAADPFQRISNSPSPTVGDYSEEYRVWDGVEALVTALESLPSRFPSLRTAAQRRFYCSRLEALRMVDEARAGELRLARDAAGDDRERFSLMREHLDALVREARASLDSVVQEDMLTASRSGVENPKEVERFLETHLKKSLERWWDDRVARLQKFIGETDLEIEKRGRSGSAALVRQVFEENGREAVRNGAAPRGRGKELSSIFQRAKTLVTKHHERQLGMKLPKAQEELRLLGQSKSFKEYADASGRRKAFKTWAEADKARKIAVRHIWLEAAPFILELGALILEETQRRELEKQKAARRADARDVLRRLGGKVADEYWQDWQLSAEEFASWIRRNEAARTAATEALESELVLAEAATARLSGVLDSACRRVEG